MAGGRAGGRNRAGPAWVPDQSLRKPWEAQARVAIQACCLPSPSPRNICRASCLVTDACSQPAKSRRRLSGDLGLSPVIPDAFASVPGSKMPPEAAFSDEITALLVQFPKQRGKQTEMKNKGENGGEIYSCVHAHTHTCESFLNTQG